MGTTLDGSRAGVPHTHGEPPGAAEPAATPPRKPRPLDRIVPGRRPPAGPGAPVPPRSPEPSTAAPPRRPRRYDVWVLLALLVAGSVPLLVGLRYDGLLSSDREARTILTADATWRRQALLAEDGWTLDRLVPVIGTEPVLDRPPGLTWMHLLAFAPLDRDQAATADLLYRARLVSVGMSLLGLGAVFWAGLSLGGLRCATMAGMVYVANPLMVIHGRMATADAATVGWAMLSIACALWAMRPLRPAPSLVRQAIGWALCGLALGAATLTRGPAVIAPVLLPLLLIGLLQRRRIAHALGLGAAGALGALLAIPWAIYVQQRTPGAWEQWLAMLKPSLSWTAMGELVGDRFIALVIGSGVWGLLLVAALVVPWAVVDRPERERAMLVWVWAVVAVVLVLTGPLLSGMDARAGTAGALLAVPVLALAVGQLLRMVGDLALAGGVSRTWKAVRLPTAGLVLIASVATPLLLHRGADGLGGVTTGYWVGMGVVLTLIGVLGAIWAQRPYPGRAVACWSVWTVLAMTLIVMPQGHNALRDAGPSAPPDLRELQDRLGAQQRSHGPRLPSVRVAGQAGR